MNHIIHVLEFITAIFATFYYKKYYKSSEKYFMHFLWFVFVLDFIIGGYIGLILKIDNIWVYNIYILISYLFYFYWYYNKLKTKLLKQITFLFILLFIIFDCYSFIVEDPKEHHINAFIFGAIINLFCTIMFFYELLSSKRIINLECTLSFWIATALLLFNIGMIPFMIYTETLIRSDQKLYMTILISLNVILYTCYSIGFIWSKKEYNQH